MARSLNKLSGNLRLTRLRLDTLDNLQLHILVHRNTVLKVDGHHLQGELDLVTVNNLVKSDSIRTGPCQA